jgi:hypothetical protein
MKRHIRTYSLLLSLGAALLVWIFGQNVFGAPVPQEVPAFARLVGVRVGTDTTEKLERQIGRGLPIAGGHPHGGRMWLVPGTHTVISADGFYYNEDGGRVLGMLSVSVMRDPVAWPPARVKERELKFMGRVALGMDRRAVLTALADALPAPKREPPLGHQPGYDLVWRESGSVRLGGINHYTMGKWVAWLRFEGGSLVDITIFSDIR